ncbi:GNAT family N-acetyltransferase [Halorarius litoreus]|uniref:GNAT family N-acetyltransferase n=1 Tax=Halorarius litoreus TaxID=2962676 RepID=UPI0020CFA15C|nr:GNAT family protein [Halorarius litoreus]
MPGPLFRQTEDGAVSLRPREREDNEFYHRNVNDPDVRRLLRNTQPKNLKAIDDEFEKYSGNDGENEGYGFVICAEQMNDEPTPVGSIGIWNVDHVNASAWMGAWIDPEFHGEEFAPRGAALVVEFGFAELNLNRVQTAVFEPNRPSQRVMEKLGFEREGVQRQAQHIDGEFYDSYLYGMLREEWDGEEWL